MRVLPAGTDALLVELDGLDSVRALYEEVRRRRAAGTLAVTDVVPAARTVLLDGLPDPAALAAELPGWRLPAVGPADGPLVQIPVVYDGADLAEVAARWGMTAAQAARTHAGFDYRVAFCGFAPGFGYLSGLPERLHVPRRPTPRTSVPAGSVGVAGEFTGVYPRASPGGWQLLGRTDLLLFDPAREPAALLAPGTRVRFVEAG